MEKELHKKLERMNSLVDYFQRGLLSEKEFEGFMKIEQAIDKLENKDMSIPNYFLTQTEYEQEQISLKEVMDVVSEDELVDMFGEGGKEEVKEYWAEENGAYQDRDGEWVV